MSAIDVTAALKTNERQNESPFIGADELLDLLFLEPNLGWEDEAEMYESLNGYES